LRWLNARTTAAADLPAERARPDRGDRFDLGRLDRQYTVILQQHDRFRGDLAQLLMLDRVDRPCVVAIELPVRMISFNTRRTASSIVLSSICQFFTASSSSWP
jgi:hypothetical protein